MLTITVDGTNITSLIYQKGLKWTNNDVDGEAAGRTLSGNMILDYVTDKDKLEIPFVPLTDTQLTQIKTLFKRSKSKQDFSVVIGDGTNTLKTLTMYKSSIPCEFLINKGDYNLWSGVQIHLIEV